MKKFLIRVAIAIAGLIGISVANNVILLKIHPLEFYYTPTGLMITAIVTGVEMLVLYPVVAWWFKKIATEWNKSLEKES